MIEYTEKQLIKIANKENIANLGDAIKSCPQSMFNRGVINIYDVNSPVCKFDIPDSQGMECVKHNCVIKQAIKEAEGDV